MNLRLFAHGLCPSQYQNRLEHERNQFVHEGPCWARAVMHKHSGGQLPSDYSQMSVQSISVQDGVYYEKAINTHIYHRGQIFNQHASSFEQCCAVLHDHEFA